MHIIKLKQFQTKICAFLPCAPFQVGGCLTCDLSYEVTLWLSTTDIRSIFQNQGVRVLHQDIQCTMYNLQLPDNATNERGVVSLQQLDETQTSCVRFSTDLNQNT